MDTLFQGYFAAFFSFQWTAEVLAIRNVLSLHNETTSFTFSAENFF